MRHWLIIFSLIMEQLAVYSVWNFSVRCFVMLPLIIKELLLGWLGDFSRKERKNGMANVLRK